MEHLPLPTKPTIGNLDISFLCTEEYDGGDFRTYPERHGWKVSRIITRRDALHRKIEVTAAEVGGLYQTWFILGLLQHMTGKCINLECLQRIESGTTLLIMVKLNDIIADWEANVSEWIADTARFTECVTDMIFCVRFAHEIMVNHRMMPQSEQSESLDLISINISTTFEVIMGAFERLRKIHHPDLEPCWLAFHICHPGPFDVLFERMQREGWCPKRITQLNAVGFLQPSLCWYIANISPPDRKNHSKCTTEKCEHVNVVDRNRYQIQHDKACADPQNCSLLGPDTECLTSIFEEGLLPIFKIECDQDGPGRLKSEAMQDDNFVAISHVWSDGHGNPKQNSLPSCFLHDLQTIVDALPRETKQPEDDGVPFWIDTLCIPRKPQDLRKKALLRLRDPYERAKHVLVLDLYLRSLDSTGMMFTELLARVEACRWIQRLWTLQEGRIGKSIWFQFEDRALGLRELFGQWLISPRSQIFSIDISITWELLGRYSATALYGSENRDSLINSLQSIRKAALTRSTSEPSDEALCLATLLHLDTKAIVEGPNSKRMEIFWCLFPEIDRGIIFSQASRKMETLGLRWAPASFIGDPWNPDWLNSHYKMAIRHSEGLIAELPAVRLCSSRSSPLTVKDLPSNFLDFLRTSSTPDTDAFFVRCSRGWLRWSFENRWHQSPAEGVALEHQVGIISKESFKISDMTNELWEDGTGLLVTFDPATHQMVRAKAHWHVSLMPERPEMCQFLKAAVRFADFILEAKSQEETEHDSIQTLDCFTGDDDVLYTLMERFEREEPDLLRILRARFERFGFELPSETLFDEVFAEVYERS